MEARIARAVRSNAKRGPKTRGHCHWPLALSIALLIAFCSLPIPLIAQAGWFWGYSWRKSHTITGSTAGAQTNYQMKIVVHYGSGSDSGSDVYCNFLCRMDFGDIRFTGSDEMSQLDYWMESKTDASSATFWVEIPSIPASPSTTTIYVYWGNSGATTTSNGVATFAFFDDAQTDKSSSYTYVNIFNPAGSATFTYSAGDKRYEITHTVADDEFIKINGLSLAQLEIWGKFNILVQGSSFNDQFGFLIRDQASGRYYSRCLDYFSPDQMMNHRNDGANPSVTETALSTATYSGNSILGNTWYQCKMHAYGNDLWFWSDLEDKSTSASESTYPGAGGCGVIVGFDVETKVAFKEIVVRNYCSPEPTHGGWSNQDPAPTPTLLTYNNKFVVTSTTAATTTSATLVNDTQATQTFSLTASQTVLVIYQANSVHGASMPQAYGMQNAINVDGTDCAKSWDAGTLANRATRNMVFWIGTLASGSHTITGRFATGLSGNTATVSNRILLIYILNGDAFLYIDSDTTSTTSGTTFADDPAAQFTFTPPSSCKALILYNVANYYSASQNENENGKKIAINVGGTDYAQADKSPYDDYYPGSVFTAWALSLSAASTTVKGRYACNIASSVYINRRQLGVLLFADSALLDTVSSDTQVSTSSTSLVDDSQATISRSTSDARELLVVAMGTKRSGTSDSYNGTCYGIMIDSVDRANSRSSPKTSGATYAHSAATAYAQSTSSGSHTIKGRFAQNAGGTSKVDSRRIVALWLSAGGGASTLLTYESKYVVTSTNAITTTSTSLQDDTEASKTFSLTASQTVLVIYQANNLHGDAMPLYGMQNAISVDGTDYARSWDAPCAANYATRNTVFWIGTLGSGSHTIKGRFAVITSGTATVSNRILLIYILNGDLYYYLDDSTNSTTSSSSFIDDPAAQFTFTPPSSCKALILYNIANLYDPAHQTEDKNGKKAAINVGGIDYSQAEKSTYMLYYADSVFTTWAMQLSATSTTVKGRFACSIASTVVVNRRQLGILLFSDDALLDTVSLDTQVSTTQTSLQDDSIGFTKLYFRSSTAATGPTSEASPDTDSFPSTPSDKNTPFDMTIAKGTSQKSIAGAYSSSSSPLYTMCRIFVGPALSAQTLTGGQANYKVGIGISESSSNMNLYGRIFVYIWRPGSGNVKTICPTTSCATEHGTSERGCVITFTGNTGDFNIQAGDRIVVEIWWDIRNTRSTSYTATDYYEGATDVVDGTATSDAAGFFICPQTLYSAATIQRTTTDYRDLLVVAMGTKRFGTTDSDYGMCYGINIDDNDRANSRGTHTGGGTYAGSVATTWAEVLAAGSHTIKGRFATNYAGGTTIVDSRRIVALWLSCPPPPVPEFSLGPLLALAVCSPILFLTKWRRRHIGGRSG